MINGMNVKEALAAGVVIAASLTAIGLLFASSALPGDSLQAKRPHETSMPYLPESMDFCGEVVPLDRQDVRESFEREIIANTFLHSSTILNIKRSGRYFPQIEEILSEQGLPDDLKYLCVAESNLIPTIGSPAGARGLWQFMEGTAKDYGLVVNDEIDERMNVQKSTRAACKMLRDNYLKLGSWSLTAASYNGGLARVRRRMDEQYQHNYYDILWTEETARYVFRILAYKAIMQSPAKYGFDINDCDKYAPIETRTVNLPTPQADLARWAIDNGSTYKELRSLNPWIVKSSIRRSFDSLQVELHK